MCEAHINEAIRSAVPGIKTVRANRKTHQAVIVSEGVIDKDAIRQAIVSSGYDFYPTSTVRMNPKVLS